jgi:hypothetical protein
LAYRFSSQCCVRFDNGRGQSNGSFTCRIRNCHELAEKQLFSRRRRYGELSEQIREQLDEKIADLIDYGMTRYEG